MKLKKTIIALGTVAGLAASGSTFAAVGGGATIHNAASLSFGGGTVTSSVNVGVNTIGTQPTIELVSGSGGSINAGEAASVDYTITSNSNGSDIYSLTGSTTDTDVGAPGAVTVTTPVTLGASIVLSSAAGQVSIPAGSEANLSPGDIVSLTVTGVEHLYTVASITAGTIASTTGNTTTPEVNTVLVLTEEPGSPVISAVNVVVGEQLGEQQTITVNFTAGNPTTPGTDGTHSINIAGNTSALNAGGTTEVIAYSDPTPSITVISGNATLLKEARNLTAAGAFATTGVSARTTEVIEYRLTSSSATATDVTGANLVDSIPVYTSYVPGSTTLNGAVVTDLPGDVSPLVGGMDINSATGAAGVIVAGEDAVVTFQVTVD